MKPIAVIAASFLIASCNKQSEAQSSDRPVTTPAEYARLTNINGSDQYGNRYFWETREVKSEPMSFQELHRFFGVTPPGENELKVQPFDYKVIDHLVQSGWHLVAVSGTPPYRDTVSNTYYNPMTVYHFSNK